MRRVARNLRTLHDARGVTLLEVAVIVAIVALLVTLALPSYQGLIRDRRVERVALDIAGVLRVAQQSAVSDSVDACGFRVEVRTTNAEVLRVARDPATRACASPEALTRLRMTDTFPSDVVVTATTVQFTSAGSLTGGPGVSIGVSSGDRTRTVRVEPATGRIEVTQ